MKTTYIHNALKGNLFGLNTMGSSEHDLSRSQVQQLNKTVYPKMDLLVIRLVNFFITRSPGVSFGSAGNRNKLMESLNDKLINKVQSSFALEAMKEMRLSLNEYLELRKFTIDLIVSGKMDEYLQAM